MTYRKILDQFTIDTLPDLDIAVLGALELFEETAAPPIDAAPYRLPLVVGSGNAEATGRILFRNTGAVFASESSAEEKLKALGAIDGVVIISASGAKHAPTLARLARDHGKAVTLITNTTHSPASRELDRSISREFVFSKNREPYTYNTSTYLGMILGTTREDPRRIREFIESSISPAIPDLSSYDKFFFIVPPQFSEIVRMFQVKFIELFGRRIARDIETAEYMRHAVTVVPSRELFVSLGVENAEWGEGDSRLHIPLPDGADFGAVMAIGYYVIAQIQKSHPPYFKEHIAAYVERVSRLYGEKLEVIVPGSAA